MASSASRYELTSLDRAEVVVVGGSLAGVAAALTAAAAGRETLLVARRPQLGWEVTAAFAFGLTGTDPAWRKVQALLERCGGWQDGVVDAPLMEMGLLHLLPEEGVRLLLYSTPLGLEHDGQTATGVLVAHKNGFGFIAAEAVVDATEGGSLWKAAGGTWIEAPESRGQYTLFLNHVAEGTLPAAVEVPETGLVTLTRSLWPGEVTVRFVVGGATPSAQLATARLALPAIVRHLRAAVPALADSLLTHTAYSLLPLTAGRAAGASPLDNLVGAGPWASEEGLPLSSLSWPFPPPPYDLSARWAMGAAAGRMVGDRLGAESAGELRRTPLHPREHPAADVVVVGGGTAGAVAAVAAARQGARTILLESSSFLGGIGTGGGIHMYYHGVAGGLQDLLDRRVEELTAVFGPPDRVRGFHPEAKKVALQEMAQEAGVEVQFEATVSAGALEGSRLQAVVAATPEGLVRYAAQVFIDSTGDADLAVKAGAAATYGRTIDELAHAYSQSAGFLDVQGTLAFFNFDAGYVDVTEVQDLTRARISGVNLYWREEGYSAADRLLYLAPLLGLRQSRQILGDYQLTLDDQVQGRSFEDTIAYVRCHYDNHAFDYENESDEALLWCWGLGFWPRIMPAEVPYRCLLPQNVEGLLIACRALSITHDAHMLFRMQRDMQRIGEAAGIAAALAARRGITPRQLGAEPVRAALLASGALKPDWSIGLPPRTPEEWAAELEGEEANLAVWCLAHAGEAAQAPLRHVLATGSPAARYRAALALAWQGDRAALPELLAALRDRRMEVPYNPHLKPEHNPLAYRVQPAWLTALALLGRLGDAAATPLVIEVLNEPHPALDPLILAIRTLARLGDERALEPLWSLLEREDLPAERFLQVSLPGGRPITIDARWQVDLALAEALFRLGNEPPASLLLPHLEDARAYVRRYAHRVAAEVGWTEERLTAEEKVETATFVRALELD